MCRNAALSHDFPSRDATLLFDDLGSTSWHNRHHRVFAQLDELLVAAGVSDLTVVIVGPGGVTRPMSPFLNDAARTNSAARKVVGDLARYSDQLLRRLPFVSLRSLEPIELDRALSMPHRLIAVDRSARLLDAVRRDLPNAECKVIDIARHAIDASADLVVAMNVISRLGDAAPAGVRNVMAALNGGGWIVMDDRSARQHLVDNHRVSQVGEKTYRVAPSDGARKSVVP
ncbi:MAG: class I SAM-dependent methyltransferase [Phycisphaerales bacterium]|nr:class I SAM-dependent methyltransferase [Phycisphaerales bacterium]MCB9857004.1 class I SAM-dependent methyltransferase [Phycisphaerales bacterium]MCB9861869.1 class I SAM-dependent methyltransferase [Phycisphaerales bacterium]